MGSAIRNFMCLCSGLLRTSSAAQRAARPRFQQSFDWLPGSLATRGGSKSHATAGHEWDCCGIMELRPGQPRAARLAAPVWATGGVPLPDPGAAGALVRVRPMSRPGRSILWPGGRWAAVPRSESPPQPTRKHAECTGQRERQNLRHVHDSRGLGFFCSNEIGGTGVLRTPRETRGLRRRVTINPLSRKSLTAEIPSSLYSNFRP